MSELKLDEILEKMDEEIEDLFTYGDMPTDSYEKLSHLLLLANKSIKKQKENIIDTQTAMEWLLEGKKVIFEKKNSHRQTFKVVNGVLKELRKNGKWKERTYLPTWYDLVEGVWIVE